VTEFHHERSVLHAEDGHDIHLQVWRPSGPLTHIIQIVHGLGEHSDRYARFAAAATARGCIVCCHDHRGHGRNRDEPGHFADTDGWNAVIIDLHTVNRRLRESHSGMPLVLLGHSMGSYIAQFYAMHFGANVNALILSASTLASRVPLSLAYAIAKIESWRLGVRGKSTLLDKLGFGNFNKAFRPARTERDWLSRDEDEVDLYVADPLCGGPYSCGLWLDLIGGLLEISSDNALSRIPSDLPILITGGAADPVGGDKGMTKLLLRYAQTGHQRLKAKIYPGGRHEMLNEINRDEVTSDWLDWVEAIGQKKAASRRMRPS
jgi:alpha-beta hydrolase superfamily lysophospholipase